MFLKLSESISNRRSPSSGGAAVAALLVMITLAIVGSFQTVGTLLVFGLLVGPPATAALIVRRVPAMMILGAVIGVASVFVGLLVSYQLMRRLRGAALRR